MKCKRGFRFIKRKELAMTIWGYARCSTNELKQNIDSQIRELKELGCKEETIYIEWESGLKKIEKS